MPNLCVMKKTASLLKIAIWVSAILIAAGYIPGCSDAVTGSDFDTPDTEGISFTVTGAHEGEYSRAGGLYDFKIGDEYILQMLINSQDNVDWDFIITGPNLNRVDELTAGTYPITDIDEEGISATFVDQSVSPQRTWTSLYYDMGGELIISSISGGVATGSFSFTAGAFGDDIAEEDRLIEISGEFQVPVNPD